MKVKSKIIDKKDLKRYNYKWNNYHIWDKELIVYWLKTIKWQLFYILNIYEPNYSTPLSYPIELFDIIDSRISKFWIANFYEGWYKFIDSDHGTEKEHIENIFIMSFPELVNNSMFYSNLSDWNKKEYDIFNKYAKLMYLEFPDTKVEYKWKIVLKPDWVECPKCNYTRPENSDLAMLECPNCQSIMHNPFYKEK